MFSIGLFLNLLALVFGCLIQVVCHVSLLEAEEERQRQEQGQVLLLEADGAADGRVSIECLSEKCPCLHCSPAATRVQLLAVRGMIEASSFSGSTLEVCPDESSVVVVKPVTEMYTDNFLHLLGEAGGVCLQGITEASPELGSTEKGNQKASFSLMDKGGYHLRVLAIGTNAEAVSELTAGSRIFVHGGELVQELA